MQVSWYSKKDGTIGGKLYAKGMRSKHPVKLVRYKKLDGRVEVGELRDGEVYAAFDQDMSELAARSSLPTRQHTHKIMQHHGLCPPVRPGKILCVGRNYAAHAEEMQNELPEKPLIFAKYASSIIGDGEEIRWRSSITQQVDWEGELAVVVGQTARNVSEDEAYKHIFGYTIANDISARDIQSSESQWIRAKAQDTFCPLGPVILTRDEIRDPHDLHLTTLVNGETMQKGYTGDMIFTIPYLVSYLSQTFTLEPGDLILTGTPAGVGKGLNPPRFLQHGDEVKVTINEIGTLTNTCVVDD